jgi:hypothetical protein
MQSVPERAWRPRTGRRFRGESGREGRSGAREGSRRGGRSGPAAESSSAPDRTCSEGIRAWLPTGKNCVSPAEGPRAQVRLRCGSYVEFLRAALPRYAPGVLQILPAVVRGPPDERRTARSGPSRRPARFRNRLSRRVVAATHGRIFTCRKLANPLSCSAKRGALFDGGVRPHSHPNLPTRRWFFP